MKAAIFKGKGKIAVEERPKPKIKEPTDAIVRVVLACVCGSDLWYYKGIEEHEEGPIGHEFIGVVGEVGSGVKDIKKGDFVIAPFAFSDNTCPHCQAGFQTACVNGGFLAWESKVMEVRLSMSVCRKPAVPLLLYLAQTFPMKH
jgi:alcohol dehydrogenase